MKRRREPQLFNFSFLDILATTIGVLLFILLFAILDQSQATVVSELEERLKGLRRDAEESTAAVQEAREAYDKAWAETQEARKKASGSAESMAATAQRMAEENRELAAQVQQLRGEIEGLTSRQKALEATLEEKQAMLDSPEGVHVLPKAKGGGRGQPVHVDCRKDGLVIHGLGGSDDEKIFCKADDVEAENGALSDLLQRIERSQTPRRYVVVLWIRPDGSRVADKAMPVIRKAGVRLGWEPADSGWVF